ncbi:MAG: hypothetical protein GY855_11170, partial [candidate division Zixibacteria bacterium]|nr:hypothetical protein [candidate division Zixibacteria bacterium]
MARKKVTDEEVEIVRRMQVDFPYYAPINRHIVPKAGGLVPLELNMFRVYVHDKLEKQLAERGYVRYLILKPRQLGCSTYIEGRYYHKVTLAKTV